MSGEAKRQDDQTDGEALLAFYLRTLGHDLPRASPQWKIPEGNRFSDLRPVKKGEEHFRADFAWPKERVIFEVQGRDHFHWKHIREDHIRHNLLTMWGYRVFYGTPDEIERDPARFIGMLRTVLVVDTEKGKTADE